MLHMDHELGSLESGKKANLVIIDENWNVRVTFRRGYSVGWGMRHPLPALKKLGYTYGS
jgi:cytosine/adenosine deaminase-related metal-dependent hydrolase